MNILLLVVLFTIAQAPARVYAMTTESVTDVTNDDWGSDSGATLIQFSSIALLLPFMVILLRSL